MSALHLGRVVADRYGLAIRGLSVNGKCRFLCVYCGGLYREGGFALSKHSEVCEPTREAFALRQAER